MEAVRMRGVVVFQRICEEGWHGFILPEGACQTLRVDEWSLDVVLRGGLFNLFVCGASVVFFLGESSGRRVSGLRLAGKEEYPVYTFDDEEVGGFRLRRGTICTTLLSGRAGFVAPDDGGEDLYIDFHSQRRRQDSSGGRIQWRVTQFARAEVGMKVVYLGYDTPRGPRVGVWYIE